MSTDALTRAMLEHPALFGKLPGHGDFVSRGVPGEWRSAIDLWLSDWLAAARVAAGDGFVALYEGAAPWLLESVQATAVLMPSIDAVGRHFPLLVLAAPGCATQQVYDAMVDAMHNGSDCDSLRQALAALVTSAQQGERSGRWFVPDGGTPDLPAPDSVKSWHSVEGCFV